MGLINSPNFNLNDDNGPLSNRIAISMMIVSLLAMVLRFAARKLVRQSFFLDDWLIVVAVAFAWATCIIEIIAVQKAEFGRHIQFSTPSTIIIFLKSLYAVQIMYPPGIAAMKLSVLLFYHRIFHIPSAKTPLIALGAITITWLISMEFVAIFPCIPIHLFWDEEKSGTCIDKVTHFLIVAIPNVVTDVFIIVFPMPILWNLKMTKSHKIALTGVFLIGGFVVVLSCLRLVTIVQAGHNPDATWALIPHGIFNLLEMNIGILCACLPSMTPLLRLAMGKKVQTTKDSAAIEGPTTGRSSRNLWDSKRGKIPGLSVLESNTGSSTWLNGAPVNEVGSILRPKTSIHGPERSQIELLELRSPADKIHVENSITWSEHSG